MRKAFFIASLLCALLGIVLATQSRSLWESQPRAALQLAAVACCLTVPSLGVACWSGARWWTES